MKTPLVTINTDKREAVYKGKPVNLPPKEFNLLTMLAEANGAVVTRKQLLTIDWGVNGEFADSRTVDQHVSRLRRKIPDVVKTVTGHGYRTDAVQIENSRDAYGKVSNIVSGFGAKPYVSFRVTVPRDVVPSLTEGQRLKVA